MDKFCLLLFSLMVISTLAVEIDFLKMLEHDIHVNRRGVLTTTQPDGGGRQRRQASSAAPAAGAGSRLKKQKKLKLNKLTQKYWKEMLDCCDVPEFITRTSRQQCYPKFKTFKGQVTVGPPSLNKKEPFNRTCLMECAFRRENLLDKANGLLSIAALNRRVRELKGAYPKWSAAIDGSFKECNKQYTSLINNELACKSGAAEYAQCMIKYMTAYCPKELETKKTTCFEKLQVFRQLLKIKATTAAPTAAPAPAAASEAGSSETAAAETTSAAAAAETTTAAAAPAPASAA